MIHTADVVARLLPKDRCEALRDAIYISKDEKLLFMHRCAAALTIDQTAAAEGFFTIAQQRIMMPAIIAKFDLWFYRDQDTWSHPDKASWFTPREQKAIKNALAERRKNRRPIKDID